ncbi:MAG TPA: hypothetical protein VF276_11705, partial [Chloroflexia bacterium]
MFAHTTMGSINWGAFARGLAVFSIGLSLMGVLTVPAATLPDRALPPDPVQSRAAPDGSFQQSALPQPIPTEPVGTIFHAAGPAEGGGFSAYLDGNITTVALQVRRFNGAAEAHPLRQTVLFYVSYSDLTHTYNCAYGPIPDGDLIGSGAGPLHLKTDTSANKEPDFYRCGPGGRIDVLLQGDQMMQHRASGDDEMAYGNLVYRSSQQATEWSALVSGSVYGMPLPVTEGTLTH